MSELKIVDGDATDKYLGTIGAGVTGDPYHNIPADFLIEVKKGNVLGHSIVHKFGHNTSIGTTYVPVASLGLYNTPQVAGATTLRIKAGGNANDTAAGTGAREITLTGVDETGAEVTETLATAGASASGTTTATFMRLYRMSVSYSGTYATQNTGSHAATITIENGAGGTDWGAIDLDGFAFGQSTIGAYTIPLGKTAYLLGAELSAETTKTIDAIFFQRANILETAAPYTAMRALFEWSGIADSRTKLIKAPINGLEELTDIGFLVKVSTGTANVDIDFEILLVDN